MINLTQHNSGELSLQVFNDQGLYNIRHRTNLKERLDDIFIYTDEQMEELEDDLAADLVEELLSDAA